VTHEAARVELSAAAVLKESWRLYKRLFLRSLLLGLVVFGVVRLVDALSRTGHGSASAAVGLLSIVLSFAGVALLEGGLVEIVRGLHDDGDADESFSGVVQNAGGRFGKLVAVSLLTGLGIGVGVVLLVVPGFVLATRWAVAVPVAMLEEGSASDALRRSRELVRGNGWPVFWVLTASGAVTLVVWIPFLVATSGSGLFAWWVAMTVASALTLPYSAHAITVIYYALTEPNRPVALEPGQRWRSIWDEEADR
jgi:hypothetical protein